MPHHELLILMVPLPLSFKFGGIPPLTFNFDCVPLFDLMCKRGLPLILTFNGAPPLTFYFSGVPPLALNLMVPHHYSVTHH